MKSEELQESAPSASPMTLESLLWRGQQLVVGKEKEEVRQDNQPRAVAGAGGDFSPLVDGVQQIPPFRPQRLNSILTNVLAILAVEEGEIDTNNSKRANDSLVRSNHNYTSAQEGPSQ